MNILLKDTTRLKAIDNRLITVCHVVYGLTRQGKSQVYLTSGIDGEHGFNSYHPEGLAWDFDRLDGNFTRKEVRYIKLTLKAIDPFYDVVYESTPGNEHLHIEWDRRRAEESKNNSTERSIQIQNKSFTGETKMGRTMKWLIDIVALVLGPVLRVVTAKFREDIENFIKEKYAEALETENPWDDFLFETLAAFFKINLNS